MHLRLAYRRLAATPAFTLGAIAVLALGTGATLAVFTVLNALLLKTLPVPDPHRLVAIEAQNSRGEPAALPRSVFDALTARQRSLVSVTGVLGGALISADADGAVHQAVVDGVTADFFDVLAASPIAGRTLVSGDHEGGAADAYPVAVIRQGYAVRMFGDDTRALGRTIVLGETRVTVVGVMPDAFAGIQIGVRTDIIVPAPVVGRIVGLPPDAVPPRYAFGRLAVDQTVDAVRAEWTAIWQSEMASLPTGQARAAGPERSLVISSGATGVSPWRTRYRDPLHATLWASAWLLLIACVNLAGLQFARALRHERAVAVSRALGATTWDVVAPAAMESLLLSLSGLLLGAPLAMWGSGAATEMMSTGSVPLALNLSADWRTWSVIGTAAILVTVSAGLIPAWLASASGAHLTTGSRVVSSHQRVGTALVVGQIALGVALLFGAGLAVTALGQVAARDHGFDTSHVVVAQLMNRPGGYTDLDDEVYYRTLLDRVTATAGVSAAALAMPLPAASSGPPALQPVRLPNAAAVLEAGVVVGSPGYFDVLGMSVLAGRPFDWRDRAGAPSVAVVSRSLARELMPGGFRSGSYIDVGSLPHHQKLEVVGIVDDASVLNVRDAAPRVVYLSALQQPPPFARWPGLMVRTTVDPQMLAPRVADVVAGLGHEFAVRTDTLADAVSRALARERLLARMATVYGALAIAMVAIGLGALLSQDVTRRRREFGVRLSVGASPNALYRSVMTRALRLSSSAVVLGAVLASMLERALSSVLGSDTTAAPWVLATVVCLLLVLAIAAAAGPARQAARTEPMAALRSE